MQPHTTSLSDIYIAEMIVTAVYMNRNTVCDYIITQYKLAAN